MPVLAAFCYWPVFQTFLLKRLEFAILYQDFCLWAHFCSIKPDTLIIVQNIFIFFNHILGDREWFSSRLCNAPNPRRVHHINLGSRPGRKSLLPLTVCCCDRSCPFASLGIFPREWRPARFDCAPVFSSSKLKQTSVFWQMTICLVSRAFPAAPMFSHVTSMKVITRQFNNMHTE